MVKKIIKQDGVSVLEVVNDYLECQHIKQLSPRTQEEYSQELTIFADWCAHHQIRTEKGKRRAVKSGSILLHEVDQHAVRLFLDHLQSTHKPNKRGKKELSSYTLNSYVRVIKSFLNWCLLDPQYGQYTSTAVILRIEKPKVVETIIETFTSEQIEALFKACNKEQSEHLQIRDRAIVAVLLDTGIRASELVNLTIGNVSLDTKDAYIRVFGKGRKWGEVGLGDQSRKYLQKYIRTFRLPTVEYEMQHLPKTHSKQRVQDATVFVGRTGEMLTIHGLGKIIKRLGEWAKIEGVRCSPHSLRHTFARMFMENGGDVYTLSRLLRHSSVSVTEHYLKSLQQSDARKHARSVLDNLNH